MIITINEFKQYLNENMLIDSTQYVNYPGISFEEDNNELNIKINNEYAGFLRFGFDFKIHGMNYISISTIDIEDKFKRKGIYTAIIKGIAYYCRKIISKGKSHNDSYGGVVSFPYDPDTDQKRSSDAESFWLNLYNNNNASRRQDKDGGYLYWTTKSFGSTNH